MAKENGGFFTRMMGEVSPVGKVWFYFVLLLMCFGGFYIGLWYSCEVKGYPIDVPYVTADNYYENQSQMEEAGKDLMGDDGILTVMLMGSDARDGDEVSRSDTLMLAFIDMETPSVGLLSIPRDTYVNIEGAGQTKINHAHSYGGEPLTRKTVEKFLNTEVDRYVEVDFEGFSALIDAIGGVDIDVETDMYKPEENIDLKKGMQHLDGYNALAYCRWRSDGQGDIGRIDRQQKFLQAVADQLMSLGTIAKLPKMIGVINDNISTDFTTGELLSLMNTFKNGASLNVYAEMVPGEGQYINGVSYWIPYENQIPELVNKMKLSPAERAAAYPEEVGGDDTEAAAETTGTTE